MDAKPPPPPAPRGAAQIFACRSCGWTGQPTELDPQGACPKCHHPTVFCEAFLHLPCGHEEKGLFVWTLRQTGENLSTFAVRAMADRAAKAIAEAQAAGKTVPPGVIETLRTLQKGE